jgi:hypothetical protein
VRAARCNAIWIWHFHVKIQCSGRGNFRTIFACQQQQIRAAEIENRLNSSCLVTGSTSGMRAAWGSYAACVWCRGWLLTTVFDYYVMTFCMCGVILFTEQRAAVGVAWSLGCCLAGAPTACLWIGLQVRVFSSCETTAWMFLYENQSTACGLVCRCGGVEACPCSWKGGVAARNCSDQSEPGLEAESIRPNLGDSNQSNRTACGLASRRSRKKFHHGESVAPFFIRAGRGQASSAGHADVAHSQLAARARVALRPRQ